MTVGGRPIEKEWLLICSRCEYMDMVKWLSKNAELAQKKDPFTVCVCVCVLGIVFKIDFGAWNCIDKIFQIFENNSEGQMAQL